MMDRYVNNVPYIAAYHDILGVSKTSTVTRWPRGLIFDSAAQNLIFDRFANRAKREAIGTLK